MIFKALGTLDFVSVTLLIGASIFPHNLLVYAAMYLILKGLFFAMISTSINNWLDIISGTYMLLVVSGISFSFMSVLVISFLSTKVFLTFVKIGVDTVSFVRFVRNNLHQKDVSSPHIYMR